MLSRLFLKKPAQLRAFSNQLFYFSSENNAPPTKKPSDEVVTNPYFNPTAAGLKRELGDTQDAIKEWQAAFKHKHGRKPTMEEMKRDPTIGNMLGGMNDQKKAISDSLRKMRLR